MGGANILNATEGQMLGFGATLLLMFLALIVGLFCAYNAKPYCPRCKKGVKALEGRMCEECGAILKDN